MYLRSSVMGGVVVTEMNAAGGWTRGYVYGESGGLTAIQQPEGYVEWVTADPVTKGQRITNSAGQVTAALEFDPFGGETSRSSNSYRQPQKYTTYTRDSNGTDDAMHRRYIAYWSRFQQPDPYDGSYNLADPQSFNRYAYVGNDPVNFTDPTGLDGVTLVPNRPHDPNRRLRGEAPRSQGDYSGGLISLARGRAEIDRQLVQPEQAIDSGIAETVDVVAPQSPQSSSAPNQAPCPPAVQKLLNDPDVEKALDEAWQKSQAGTPDYHEEGGWIFANKKNNSLRIIEAKPGKPSSMPSMATNLTPKPRGYRLIAWFHTHPRGTASPSPSDKDVTKILDVSGIGRYAENKVFVYRKNGNTCLQSS